MHASSWRQSVLNGVAEARDFSAKAVVTVLEKTGESLRAGGADGAGAARPSAAPLAAFPLKFQGCAWYQS